MLEYYVLGRQYSGLQTNNSCLLVRCHDSAIKLLGYCRAVTPRYDCVSIQVSVVT